MVILTGDIVDIQLEYGDCPDEAEDADTGRVLRSCTD